MCQRASTQFQCDANVAPEMRVKKSALLEGMTAGASIMTDM